MSPASPSGNSRYILVLGFALFAMFFGAGNLIFPPLLGKSTGDQFPFAIAGFLLTGVGLPLMGVLASAKAAGGLDLIAGRVGPTFGKIFSLIVMLLIGPLLAIPRTCATSFELAILPNTELMGSWVFSFIYFGAVLFFVLNPSNVVDKIGKYLTPALLISLLLLIIRGITNPFSSPVETNVSHPFGKSFIEGYQTMDLMAAVVFSIVMLNEINARGISDKKRQISIIIRAGLIAAVSLAVVYGGLVYLGAMSGNSFGDITRTELLINISGNLLGTTGAVVLGVAVLMACLTTAIGLTAVFGQYFSKLTSGRVGYKTGCISVSAASLVLANAGVESIIKLAVPLLVAVYPVVIVLVLLTLAGDLLNKRNIWRGAVAGAFMVGTMDAARTCGLSAASINAIFDILPLTNQGMGWIVPAVVLGVAGALVDQFRGRLLFFQMK